MGDYKPSDPITRSDARRLMGAAWGNWYWANRWKDEKQKRVELILDYRKYRKLLKTAVVETNERGNEIYRDVDADEKLGVRRGTERYFYDFEGLDRAEWKQFDTDQDASYFGVWVNVAKRMTFSYTEGDRTLVVCPTAESFRAELEDAERFYGPAPYAAVGIDADGAVTKYYDERPKAV
jgi:hypothetical protein